MIPRKRQEKKWCHSPKGDLVVGVVIVKPVAVLVVVLKVVVAEE